MSGHGRNRKACSLSCGLMSGHEPYKKLCSLLCSLMSGHGEFQRVVFFVVFLDVRIWWSSRKLCSLICGYMFGHGGLIRRETIMHISCSNASMHNNNRLSLFNLVLFIISSDFSNIIFKNSKKRQENIVS